MNGIEPMRASENIPGNRHGVAVTRHARADRRLGGRAHARRFIEVLFVLGVWILASGTSCPRVLQQYTQPLPRALPPSASLTQVIDVVNDNSARVQALSATRATITTPGLPSLNANIAFQRPRSFRLVAQKFMSPEVDLGSNDELLWFWLKRAQPPALLYCRHNEFAVSSARQVMPVEPEWLIEALGIVTFDPASQIEGPFPTGVGRLELKSKMPPGGLAASRITIIDESRGTVLEEHVYDSRGTRLATRHVEQARSRSGQRRHAAAARRDAVAAGQLQLHDRLGRRADQSAQRQPGRAVRQAGVSRLQRDRPGPPQRRSRPPRPAPTPRRRKRGTESPATEVRFAAASHTNPKRQRGCFVGATAGLPSSEQSAAASALPQTLPSVGRHPAVQCRSIGGTI